VALSEIDRNLLDRCLTRKPRAWEDFVDRFMGLVVHVINHTAQARSIRLTPEDRDDLCGDVFLAVIKDDYAVLRHFRAQSSLATYLAVVARRVVVRQLLHNKSANRLVQTAAQSNPSATPEPDVSGDHEQRVSDREEVAKLLAELNGHEAEVVRMYHLEGKSYQEISSVVGIAENSIGPTLSRAREKMKRMSADPAV
jgi:RNA polymerase sigma-70 factor (ECF subfamily)